jgi:hypothetical protein
MIGDLLLTTPTRIGGGDEADLEENLVAGGSPPASVLLSDGEEENNGSNDLNTIQAIASLEKRILKTFVHSSVEDYAYTAKVKSVLKLILVAKFVAIGVSFRQASKLYHSVKERTGMGSLGSVTDHEIGHLCQIECAVNLQYLKELFKKIWAFSIGLDAGNNEGSLYLDLRMRSFLKGNLQNLHLLAIPMQEQRTNEYQYNLVVSLLEHQLIGIIATDGASTMTGCRKGTFTRLSNECHSQIFRIWCGAHQLDLVMKRSFNKLSRIPIPCALVHALYFEHQCHSFLKSCFVVGSPSFGTTFFLSLEAPPFLSEALTLQPLDFPLGLPSFPPFLSALADESIFLT